MFLPVLFFSNRQVLIVIKYVFQFAFYPWNNVNSKDYTKYQQIEQQDPLFPIFVFGLEKHDSYAAFDLFLLFAVFIHRSMLKVEKC